jgi:hypothetical protein
MRVRMTMAMVGAAMAAMTLPASADGLVIPAEKPSFNEAAINAPNALPWTNQQPNPHLTEKPIGEVVAARLGLVNGSAELFRFRVENAPSSRTMLDGLVDGGGIKLKLTW